MCRKSSCTNSEIWWAAAIILAIMGSLSVSCSEPTVTTLSLAQKNKADTLYLEIVKTLRPELDSLCKISFEENVTKALDSILADWKNEELKMRERLKLNQ